MENIRNITKKNLTQVKTMVFVSFIFSINKLYHKL